ncbi:Uncharacterized protein Rs2_04988 [Raphanus sativus]|nr:Uncharacterized protein Rs2_04988 [Raphanus sativus]
MTLKKTGPGETHNRQGVRKGSYSLRMDLEGSEPVNGKRSHIGAWKHLNEHMVYQLPTQVAAVWDKGMTPCLLPSVRYVSNQEGINIETLRPPPARSRTIYKGRNLEAKRGDLKLGGLKKIFKRSMRIGKRPVKTSDCFGASQEPFYSGDDELQFESSRNIVLR